MRRVKHWWNGAWGRMARRDVEIWTGILWKVVLRRGGAEGTEKVRWFEYEDQAQAFAAQCQRDGTGRAWQEVPHEPEPDQP